MSGNASNAEQPEIITQYVRHLTLQGRSPNTRRLYLGALSNLRRWLGEDADLLSTNLEILTQWREELTVGPASVLAYAAGIRGFYKWALRQRLIQESPAEFIPLPRLGRRLPRPIREDDLELAIDTAPFRIRPWLVLAAYAGLRCCEISRLRREDVLDSAVNPGLMLRGKGDKERWVPMSPYVWHEIRPTLPRRGWLYLRQDRTGPISPSIVTQRGNWHLSECGLHDTMHQLRHRYGTRVQQACHDIRVTQELMGHQSPNSTAGYAAHEIPAAVQAVYDIQPKRSLRAVHDTEGQA